MIHIDARLHDTTWMSVFVSGRWERNVTWLFALWNGGPGIVRKARMIAGRPVVARGGGVVEHYVPAIRVRVTRIAPK